MDWQPIETAPQEKYVLAFQAGGDPTGGDLGFYLAINDPQDGGWFCDTPSGMWEQVDPTHWMPLPAPPVST